jgi:very-short-patch-repair endonuclease
MWLRACLPSPGGGGSPPQAAGWGDEVPKTRSIDQFKRKTARRLRKNSTDAELRLWRYLRRLEIRGTHFRRQMPIGNFVVDFACPAAHLIVEVNGSQHGEADVQIRDEKRTRWLESEGYRVLRFWNSDVTRNIDSVMEAIYAELLGSREAPARKLKHTRHRRVSDGKVFTPPRRAARADPPPPGEGRENS